jgi:outer membrane protein TolC
MKNLLFTFLISISTLSFGYAQERILSLENVLQIAMEQSPDALIAKHRFRNSYWQYKFYLAERLPSLSLDATLPDIQNRIVKENIGGISSYFRQNTLSFRGGFQLDQSIPMTGGNIFVNTSLEQTINYLSDTTTTNFLSVPVYIGYNQPLFQFNRFKWDKKIEPVKYVIAKKQYLTDVESVNIAAIKVFFDLFEAQVQLKIAQINYQNYDTLYKVAKGRYDLGRIGENEVLQMELSILKAESAVERNQMAVDDAMLSLKSFLRLKEDEKIILVAPDPEFFKLIDNDLALEKAKQNSIDYLNFEKRLLEAKREVSRAKNYGFNANLFMAYGLNGNADVFDLVYKDPSSQEVLRLGLNIPILDWGKRKGQMKMAESNEELVKTSVEQEQTDFAQSIKLKVGEFNVQKNQVMIAAKSDTIARKSYEVSKNRYLIGKIGVTDLNIAQTDQDEAQLTYINAMRAYWRNYYVLRQATLYDFMKKQDLNVNYEDIYDD